MPDILHPARLLQPGKSPQVASSTQALAAEDSLRSFTAFIPSLEEQLNCKPLVLAGRTKVRFLWQRAYKGVVTQLISQKIALLEEAHRDSSPRSKQVISVVTDRLRAIRRWKQIGHTATSISRMQSRGPNPKLAGLPQWTDDVEVNRSMSSGTPFFTLVNKLIAANRACVGVRRDKARRNSAVF